MSSPEKILALIFLIAAIFLTGIKTRNDFIEKTQLAPADGGIYHEGMVGDIKYLNPILASTPNEKSFSRLVFSGLVKFDKDGNVLPDLAEKWEVLPDNLHYKFHLRKNAKFHDGAKVTAQDVIFTVDQIKNPVVQSPLFELWKDVNVTAEDDSTVVFELPKEYGPFIYNFNFGIVPSYMSDADFSKKLIGTGPYKYVDSKVAAGKISKINLEKNTNYFEGNPKIDEIILDFYKNKEEAKEAFLTNKEDGLAGVDVQGGNLISIQSQKRLGLIFNLRKDYLRDKSVRQEIVGSEKLNEPITLTLATLDGEPQKQKAEEIKKSFSERNIIINIKYYSSVEMQKVLSSRDYDLLLYGFDFGHDRDPYIFWHSSQMDKKNYAGYSDKNSDILLEDARMMTNTVARNAEYDKFFKVINDEALAVFFEPISYPYAISHEIKGVSINSNDLDSRFDGIINWYIKEKRVKK